MRRRPSLALESSHAMYDLNNTSILSHADLPDTQAAPPVAQADVEMGRRRSRSFLTAVVAGVVGLGVGGLMLAGVAHSDPPPPSAQVKIPYVAKVYASGMPVTGTSAITVRLYDSPANDALLVFEETFDSVPVFQGELALTIGTGVAVEGNLGLEEIAAHPDLAVELAVGGNVISPRQRMGSVPRSVAARSVPANGVLYGGDHGLVPAQAIERPIIMETQVVASSSSVAPPQGYMCTYQTRLPAFQVPVESKLDDLDASNMWISYVGDSQLNLSQANPWLALETGVQPFSTAPVEVHAQRLWSTCGTPWTYTCKWQAEDIDRSVEVTSICVPVGS